MKKQAILITVAGTDRPGMVSALAGVVSAHGGNWLESRMANLSGQFAGILRVEVDETRQPALLEALQAMESSSYHVTLLPVDESDGVPAGHDVELTLLGQDHPGIVRDITRLLAQSGVSVQAFDSHLEDASMAGGVLFHAHALLRVPEHMSTEELHGQLHGLSDSLMVDIQLADREQAG
ncbi:MAG: glycine cleavage system protein R [Granulosicoccus sp.]|nr:glycine cleavage system protein R [Granulosicoccus sp.]